MRRIWLIARNDLRLTMRDRAAFFWMLALPVFLMWVLGSVAGGNDSDDWRISLTVSNRDDGWLGRALVDEVRDDRIRMREETPDEQPSQESKIRTLVIPEGFTEKVLAGEQQELRMEREPGSDTGFGIGAQMHILRAITRSIGRLVELEGELAAADPGADFSERFRALGDRPRLVGLDVANAGKGTPVPSGFGQSVPGTLTMIVLMMTMIYGAVFLTVEKQSGMLRRQAGLPVSKTEIYLGKLLGRMLVALAQLVVLGLIGTWLFDFSWGGSPLGLAVMFVSFAVAVAGLSTLMGAVLSNAAQASSVGWILSMVLAALGGCWWPSEVMPGWLRAASHVLPTTWAMNGFHALISFGQGIEAVLLPAAVLLGFGALFSIAGARLLRFD